MVQLCECALADRIKKRNLAGPLHSRTINHLNLGFNSVAAAAIELEHDR